MKGSPRKLNMLARQIRNLPVDEAIKQMEFSPKRTARKILHNLAFARKNATEQKDMKNLVVGMFDLFIIERIRTAVGGTKCKRELFQFSKG